MIVNVDDFTIVAMPTLSGLLECRVYKGRNLEKRIKGDLIRFNGFPTFLAESMEDAKSKVRRELGLDQSTLEDFYE